MDDIIINSKAYDFKKKDDDIKEFNRDMVNRTLTMFRYKKLPESLPERELELILQLQGYGLITEYENELVALWGTFAPPNDIYYRPKNILVNNPWANINRTYEIYRDKEGVLVRNDPLNRGLLPIFTHYGTLMTEAELTFYRALINFRAMFVFTGDDDADKESADIFMKKIEDGEAGVMVTGSFDKEVSAQPLLGASGNYITQSIEAQQYVLGMLYQKIGIQSTFNMKRERLTANESNLDTDPLRPLIDCMMEERQNAIERVNKKYGTDITVEFDSSWEKYNSSLVEDGDGLPNEDENVSRETLNEETEDESIETDPETVEQTTEESTEEVLSETSEEDNAETDEGEVTEALDTVEEIVEDIKDIVEEVSTEESEVESNETENS